MSKTFATNYPLYEPVYGDQIPIEQYYIILFDMLPSKHNDNKLYDESVLEFFLTCGYLCEIQTTHKSRSGELMSNKIFINRKNNSIVKVGYFNNNSGNEEFNKIEICYSVISTPLHELFDWNKLKTYERTKKKKGISLVKVELGHLDVEQYDLPIPEIDIELNYGKGFTKIHDTIVKRLNTDSDKGIILLHGDPGSGKTTYIKYLTSLIKNKDILFIPPSMAETLSEPSIIPFLMEHKNSILIIEDSERVISDRETTGSPSGVSNILNLTDGILGDCLGIQIIATFNMKREKIDQALLRKGRLIAEHKFDKLTVTETNDLLKHLGKDYVVKEGMVLSDIYNIDVEEIKTQKIQKIGFK